MISPKDTANRIKYLAKLKKVSVSKLLADCDLNKNVISTMQNNGYFPRLEAIVKIADYLECPIDFLLGRGLFKEWDLIIKYRKEITANLETVYPFLKDYHLLDLPESALMNILPSVIQRVTFEDNQIQIYFL